MKQRYTAYLMAVGVLLVFGAMMATVALTLQTAPKLQGTIIRGTAFVLFLFLCLLVLRFLGLLWLGFLQYIEESAREYAVADEETFLPPVSIIVPAYNEGKVIRASIRSLLRQDYPRFEILVVDDGSSDDTFERAADLEGHYGSATVRVVRKNNGGKAAALNTGISLARHGFVLCMDGDSVLAPQTLRRAIRHFRDPNLGAVAGNVKVSNRVNLWTRLQALEYIEGLNMPRRAQSLMRAVNIIPGPIGVFRRDVLVQLGGYETDTFAEDADLTLKILARGWRVVYEDQAIAYTEAPETLTQLIKQRYRWTRGILQALRKRKHTLFSSGSSNTVRLSVGMMTFEAIAWPLMDVVGSLFFVLLALTGSGAEYLVAWWVLLTLLDVAAALYSVVMEEEDLSLVPFALVYRFFFILMIDVVKLYATLEEALRLEMTWGQLQRVGRFE